MCPLLTGTLNAKHNRPEINEHASDGQVQQSIDEPNGLCVESLGKPVNAKPKCKDGIIESWIIVVNICYSCHDNKRKIMKNPSNDRIYPRVVDMVNMGLAKVLVTSLPADKVPKDQEPKDAQAECASPVNKRVSEKVIFDGVVVPGAHTKADIENWPLPELRREIILFIWIRDKSIVRSHHGNI